MSETPEKGRGTTGFGRPTDRTRRNRLWQAGSVPGPYHPNSKGVSLAPIRLVHAFSLPKTAALTGFGEQCEIAGNSANLRCSRQSGRSGAEDLVCGGGVCRSRRSSERKASSDRRERDDPRREREAPGLRAGWSRSRSGRLSVTCLLRHIPPRAVAFCRGREAKSPKSGVKR